MGCFNNKVVALIADKVERQGLCEVNLVTDTDCISQPDVFCIVSTWHWYIPLMAIVWTCNSSTTSQERLSS